jgi:hypothetical protein
MKQKSWHTRFLTILLCLLLLPCLPVTADDTETDNLIDSGIDYQESVETISNPGAGYTSTIWYTCKPDNTPVYNPTSNLVLMFIDIGAFSSGMNGTTDSDDNYVDGIDYDLDETFFQNVRATFENCRKNGCTIAVRFRYDASGTDNPEPATFDQVLHHIQQIKDNGLLEDYKDILMFVESGFVGKWGEQHGGKYTSLDYKVKLLDAMLDCVPEEIPVTVRTPNIFASWAGITTAEMADYVAEPGSDAARVGLYNDGYMGSDSDLGTFSNRAAETAWMQKQMLHTYYGGEFSGNLTWAQKYDTYLPENAVPEMYQTHLSYINSNIFSLYKDYTFGEEYDVENVDNSAYYGQTVFQFIRDHIGYRFVIRKSELSQTVTAGTQLQCQFSIENTGFANPLHEMKAEVILERNGEYIQTTVALDPTTWYSCTTTEIPLTLQLPGDLEAGDWNVYLRLSVGDQDYTNSSLRTVHFANANVWNSMLGANYLGSVSITETEDPTLLTQHTFYQVNPDQEVSVSDGARYTTKQVTLVDGQRSSDTEWQSEMQYIATDAGNLYLTNDDQYLYVMAEIQQDAASPVYNLQIFNAETQKRYWIYYQANGYVYFNNGSYEGCICKHVGDCVEFRIPFSAIDAQAGTELSTVRVSIQDSSVDGWSTVGNLITDQSYYITDTFTTYNAPRSMVLQGQETVTLSAFCGMTDVTYQWYQNGDSIPDATASTYTIDEANEQDIGVYTVLITAPSGTQKTVSVCEITDVTDVTNATLLGDVNTDGSCDLLDVVLLQKYLLQIVDASALSIEQADCNPDNQINIIDLLLLKRMILS